MPKLGVVGTLVRDRIHARNGEAAPIEEWGGIAYSLEALAAAIPEGWEVVPILMIGEDGAEEALSFLRTIPGIDVETAVRVVPEPNFRVELYYIDHDRRTERLSGGVPAWRWSELEPILPGLDALYVNFITGFELELETARLVRQGFTGPIYADLHSLFLSVDPDGQRAPRPLEAWREWLRCFDIVQVNEDELTSLADGWDDPWRFAAQVVGETPCGIFVTLGPRGATSIVSPEFDRWAQRARAVALGHERPLAFPGPARSQHVPLNSPPVEGDPTGCGDVWGSTCFSRLLAGSSLEAALQAANRAAARNVTHRGASGLHLYLQGRIQT